MSEEVKMMMERYGITSEPKMIYSYKQFRYENFTDALRYAESDSKLVQGIPVNTLTEA